MVVWDSSPSNSRGRSGVRLVKGQFVYDPLPLSERMSRRLRDPLSGVTNEERSEYQTRYRQTLREQEIQLIDNLMDQGATFDPEELAKKRPGEILEALQPGHGAIFRGKKYTEEQAQALSDALGIDLRNQELAGQIEALGGTAPPRNKGPSGIMRALDIISRPGYAVSEMVDSSLESQAEGNGFWENLGASLQGAGRGLTGQDKTTMHDNLKEHGIPALGVDPMKEGKWTGVLGFGLDVVTDPTTYFTLGTGTAVEQGLKQAAKAGSREVVEEAAIRGGRQLAEEGVEELVEEGAERVMRRTLEEAASSEKVLGGVGSKAERKSIRDAAVDLAKQEAKATGTKLTTKQLDDIGKDALRKAEDAAIHRSADTAVEARRLTESLASTKRVELKFMGKPIAASEKAYRPLRAVGSLKNTKAGGYLNRAFRTDAEVGGEVRRLERQFSNVSAAQYEDELRSIQKAFSGTSKKARKAVARAIETGDTQAISGSPKLVSMYDEAKRWFDEIASREMEAGVLNQEDLVDNYLYHVYRTRAGRRIKGPIPNKKGKFSTLEEARRMGANPVEDIADILAHRLAKSHRIVAQYDLYREVAARFGLDLSAGTVKNKAMKRLVKDGYITSGREVSHIMPKGIYFDAEVTSSLRKLDAFFGSDDAIRDFTRGFDRIQAKFKFAMTAPNPGFHIRNLLGDYIANMLDGVVDPRIYNWAYRVLREGEFPKGTLRIGKNSVSAADIKILYEGQGLKSGFFHADTGLIPSPGRRILSKASSATRTASEFREDWMRMAHFVDALKKEATTKKGAQQSMETLAEKAAARVKKFNFDYQDLTNLEKRVFRRAVPFYTFMRKNIPLQMEMLFTRPGRVAVIPKGMRAMQEIIGEDPGEDPFPGMPEVIPDWIREFPTIQTQVGDTTEPSVFLQPDFTINQLQDFLGGFVTDSGNFSASAGTRQFGSELIGAASPVATIPAEYFMQRDLQSGAPMEMSFKDTVLNQIPAYGTAKVVRDPDEGQAMQQVSVGGRTMSERLLNYLTGAGVRVNTPQRQKSQLKRDEDILRAILAKLEEEMLAETGG